MTARLLGAVLAGGRSARFGEDKAYVRVGGRPMVERALGVLREVLPEVVVVGGDGPSVDGAPVLMDRRPGEGPLAGLEAALHEASDRGLDGVFLLACDLPLLSADAVRAVVARAREATTALAPARKGGVETTCAIYAVSVLPVVTSRLDAGERSLHGLFEAVAGEALELGAELDPALFVNVNTPADRVRAEAALLARDELA